MQAKIKNPITLFSLIITIFICACSQEEVVLPEQMEENEEENQEEIIDIPKENLILHLPFNHSMADSSENEFVVLVHGEPQLSSNRHGDPDQALSLSSNSDFLEIRHHENLNLDHDFTISVWLKPEARHSKYLIHKAFDINGGGPYSLDYFYGKPRFVLSYDDNPPQVLEAHQEITVSDWQHFAVVKIGDLTKLYFDGKVVDQNSTNQEIAISKNSLFIGTYLWGQAHGGPVTFRGKIDDVRIYDFGLSEKEIQHIMDI